MEKIIFLFPYKIIKIFYTHYSTRWKVFQDTLKLLPVWIIRFLTYISTFDAKITSNILCIIWFLFLLLLFFSIFMNIYKIFLNKFTHKYWVYSQHMLIRLNSKKLSLKKFGEIRRISFEGNIHFHLIFFSFKMCEGKIILNRA